MDDMMDLFDVDDRRSMRRLRAELRTFAFHRDEAFAHTRWVAVARRIDSLSSSSLSNPSTSFLRLASFSGSRVRARRRFALQQVMVVINTVMTSASTTDITAMSVVRTDVSEAVVTFQPFGRFGEKDDEVAAGVADAASSTAGLGVAVGVEQYC
jgi:hypothetical protein